MTKVTYDKISRAEEKRALDLHKKAIVVDGLDLSWLIEDEWFPKVQAGGIDVAVIDISDSLWGRKGF